MNNKTKKFIVVPACTDLNRGDQALVWESVNLLLDIFGPNTEIDILDYGNTPEERARQSGQTKGAGYNVIRNLIENPKRAVTDNRKHLTPSSYLKVALTALMDFSKQLVLFLLPYRVIARAIFLHEDKVDSFERLRTADGCVVKGGGFVHTYGHLQDPYYLWFNLYYVILALRLGKEVIFFPNSFGPINGRLNRLILRTILNRCALVYTRESISQKCLQGIGCRNVRASVDLAFYCKVGNKLRSRANIQDRGKPKIGITVRPYRFPESADSGKSYEDYVRAVAGFCDCRIDSDIYFIVQVQGPSMHEDDRIAISDVLNLSKRKDLRVIDGDYDYKDLIAIYSKMDYLIGTRFHSVIFSQISRIPCLAVAYGGNKSQGIMAELDLSKFVVDINAVSSEKLNVLFDELRKDERTVVKKLDSFFSTLPTFRKKIFMDLRNLYQ